jgi:hypothetical protein
MKLAIHKRSKYFAVGKRNKRRGKNRLRHKSRNSRSTT